MKYTHGLKPLAGDKRQELIDTLPLVFRECIELIESEIDEATQPQTATALRVLSACYERLAPPVDEEALQKTRAALWGGERPKLTGVRFVSVDHHRSRIYLGPDQESTHYLAPVGDMWKTHLIDGTVTDEPCVAIIEPLPADNLVCARYHAWYRAYLETL